MKRLVIGTMVLCFALAAAGCSDKVEAGTVASGSEMTEVTELSVSETDPTAITYIEPAESTLFGEWDSEDEVYAFSEDGSGFYVQGERTTAIVWYDDGASITISYDDTGDQTSYEYSIAGTSLTLTAGSETRSFTKN